MTFQVVQISNNPPGNLIIFAVKNDFCLWLMETYLPCVYQFSETFFVHFGKHLVNSLGHWFPHQHQPEINQLLINN